MSETPIQKDDFVVCIRGCPQCKFRLGFMFTVLEVGPHGKSGFRCASCKDIVSFEAIGARHYKGGMVPLSWLKRIDPPAEQEETREPVEIEI